MSVQPGPQISGPTIGSGMTVEVVNGADRIGSTTDGGHQTDLFEPTRRCGRCRLDFPIGADVDPMELRDWWACAACTEALLPTRVPDRSPT